MAGRIHKRHKQLHLDDARREEGQGGWRRNAGRKRKPGAISHRRREQFASGHPIHVTIRLADDVPSIARDYLMPRIREVIAKAHKPDFRIVEFNVLDNHLHLVVEAANVGALSRGMQGFSVRLARRMNAALKRKGAFVAHRYHARALRTPLEVRNVLRYVLLNRKHHAAGKKFSTYWVDPYSSAAWFTGWAAPISRYAWMVSDLVDTPAPTHPATVWLLKTGWKKLHGPLRFDDRPS